MTLGPPGKSRVTSHLPYLITSAKSFLACEVTCLHSWFGCTGSWPQGGQPRAGVLWEVVPPPAAPQALHWAWPLLALPPTSPTVSRADTGPGGSSSQEALPPPTLRPGCGGQLLGPGLRGRLWCAAGAWVTKHHGPQCKRHSFSRNLKAGVQDQGVGRAGSFQGRVLWPADGRFFPCLCILLPLCPTRTPASGLGPL